MRTKAAPVFDLPPEELWSLWLHVADTAPRCQRVAADQETLTSHHVQKTRYLRFPDDIHAEVIDLGNRNSAIAILSRSRYGSIDFGINEKRVTRWMTRLQNRIRAQGMLRGMQNSR